MISSEQEGELEYLEGLVRWFEEEIRKMAIQRDKLWPRIDELVRLRQDEED